MTIKKVERLQKQVLDHQKRIEDLERLLRGPKNTESCAPLSEHQADEDQLLPRTIIDRSIGSEHSQASNIDLDQIFSLGNAVTNGITGDGGDGSTVDTSAPATHPETERSFTMDAVDLDTPMSTLRNLATLSKEKEASSPTMPYHPILPSFSREELANFEQDPVAQGILTMEEAQHAFDIDLNFQGLHENYRSLVALLDVSISRLLLQPKISDVNLDHIRCLLLYIQWMPVEQDTTGICQTRYNDISAWSVLGLAIRYSLFLGLDSTAVSPFSSPQTKTPTEDDFAKLRVWINLLTCDCHLMLSAGLPASLDPEPVAKVARSFFKQENALQPDDSRIAAISELVGIIRKAARSSGDPSVRKLDSKTLQKANAEFDDWEAYWTPLLGNNAPF
ncbi:hypothetical protein G7Y89_g4508 [Cudoniella acicularis]|uniref:Transcription factor domain-containing protein n=1 Tax=Cudoniella acicularis TaxID=354080 RepID=A0A8H4RRG4_9HELO|nr:hypothetical protein G7Y89_g4508 [Cudoniella acicularis]